MPEEREDATLRKESSKIKWQIAIVALQWRWVVRMANCYCCSSVAVGCAYFGLGIVVAMISQKQTQYSVPCVKSTCNPWQAYS